MQIWICTTQCTLSENEQLKLIAFVSAIAISKYKIERRKKENESQPHHFVSFLIIFAVIVDRQQSNTKFDYALADSNDWWHRNASVGYQYHNNFENGDRIPK